MINTAPVEAGAKLADDRPRQSTSTRTATTPGILLRDLQGRGGRQDVHADHGGAGVVEEGVQGTATRAIVNPHAHRSGESPPQGGIRARGQCSLRTASASWSAMSVSRAPAEARRSGKVASRGGCRQAPASRSSPRERSDAADPPGPAWKPRAGPARALRPRALGSPNKAGSGLGRRAGARRQRHRQIWGPGRARRAHRPPPDRRADFTVDDGRCPSS